MTAMASGWIIRSAANRRASSAARSAVTWSGYPIAMRSAMTGSFSVGRGLRVPGGTVPPELPVDHHPHRTTGPLRRRGEDGSPGSGDAAEADPRHRHPSAADGDAISSDGRARQGGLPVAQRRTAAPTGRVIELPERRTVRAVGFVPVEAKLHRPVRRPGFVVRG